MCHRLLRLDRRASWERLCKTLGLPKDQALSVIADGARWIWEQAARRFPGKDVQWIVDIYHAMLYLFAAAAALGTKGARQWVAARVIELIEMGGPRFIEHLQTTGPPDPTPAVPPKLGESYCITCARIATVCGTESDCRRACRSAAA